MNKTIKIILSLVATIVTSFVFSVIMSFQNMLVRGFSGPTLALPFPIKKYCGSVANPETCPPTYIWWGIILSVISWAMIFTVVYTFRQTSWKRRILGLVLVLIILAGATYSVDRNFNVLRYFSEPVVQDVLLKTVPNDSVVIIPGSVSATFGKIGGKLSLPLPNKEEVTLSVPLNALSADTKVEIKKLEAIPKTTEETKKLTIVPGTIVEISFSGQTLTKDATITIPMPDPGAPLFRCVVIYYPEKDEVFVPQQFVTRDLKGVDVYTTEGGIFLIVDMTDTANGGN